MKALLLGLLMLGNAMAQERPQLAPEGDQVVFQGRNVHVASWAKRFLFRPDQLELPVGRLSGGEQARILIARLMREPADVLMLDEPTNDLDIPTLEVLEESLAEFAGGLVLVTHDRLMLDRVSTAIVEVWSDHGHYPHLADPDDPVVVIRDLLLDPLEVRIAQVQAVGMEAQTRPHRLGLGAGRREDPGVGLGVDADADDPPHVVRAGGLEDGADIVEGRVVQVTVAVDGHCAPPEC